MFLKEGRNGASFSQFFYASFFLKYFGIFLLKASPVKNVFLANSVFGLFPKPLPKTFTEKYFFDYVKPVIMKGPTSEI